jgi:NADPH:quinone reductase
MEEALIDSNGVVTIHKTEVPVPGAHQLLIKVVVSGINPKDWKYPRWEPEKGPFNYGDDIAGFVEKVGAYTIGFKKGDKVAAFHQMLSPHGSWAEYAIAWEYTTCHLPPEVALEGMSTRRLTCTKPTKGCVVSTEAATVPLAGLTASLALYQRLALPLPWNAALRSVPLVIYGGSTAVGAFAIKLAMRSNIHPIIAIAGRGTNFVETLIDRGRGDMVLDYREGSEVIQQKVCQAFGKIPIHHAVDAISERGSVQIVTAILTAPAIITTMLPTQQDDSHPPDIAVIQINIATVHQPPAKGQQADDRQFAAAFFPFLGRGLREGWFSGHPYEVRGGGLAGIGAALKDLEAGVASALKYVIRISDALL